MFICQKEKDDLIAWPSGSMVTYHIEAKSRGSGNTQLRFKFPDLLFTSCVTLSKLLSHSESTSSHVQVMCLIYLASKCSKNTIAVVIISRFVIWASLGEYLEFQNQIFKILWSYNHIYDLQGKNSLPFGKPSSSRNTDDLRIVLCS